MNKRGSIPVVILVLGVLAVCTLALISFYVSNFKVQNSFVGVNLMEKANSQIEQQLFNEQDAGEVYIEETKTKVVPRWSLDWKEERVVFSIEYSP